MSNKWVFVFLLFIGTITAQKSKFNSEELHIKSLTDSTLIDGTLLIPKSSKKIPLVIIIQGSGPTDRDGNQASLKNNSLKFLAEDLYTNQIASFRYDKRLVKLVLNGTFKESDADFNDFINDAKAVVTYLKDDSRFNKIIIIGHSQGSLVGMIAAQNNTDAYISLAGAGQEIDDVVIDQIEKQAPNLKDNARQSFDDLRVNGVAQNYDPLLTSIFRPSLQLFMLSWMQYNPQTEIAKLEIPVLIINGDKDLQVQVSEAEKLKSVKPDASFEIITDMNHILKEIKGTFVENRQSYNNDTLPNTPKLISIISSFIKQL